MWNYLCLLTFLTIVTCSSVEDNNINDFLVIVKKTLDVLKCDKTEFLTGKIPNPALPAHIKDLKVVEFVDDKVEVSLDFTFKYVTRNTTSVIIARNAILYLKYNKYENDFIMPLPERFKSDENSLIEYYKTAEYFLVKWSHVGVQTKSSKKADYNVAILILNSGEILIAYEKIGDHTIDVNEEIQIVNYHNVTESQKLIYIGTSLDLSNITTSSIVYIKQCSVEKTGPITTPAPIPTPKIKANYVTRADRVTYLLKSVREKSLIEVPETGKIIPFNFTFNDISFQTIRIEPKGKILLNVTPQGLPQVQVEPIPQTDNVVILSLRLKYHETPEELILLLTDLKIRTVELTNSDNEIILAFKKSGIIQIVYNNLINRDIDGRTVVMQTYNNSHTTIEGDVDFAAIINATIVLFGATTPVTDLDIGEVTKPLLFNDLLSYFESNSISALPDANLLNKYFELNADDVASLFEKGIATIESKFEIDINGKDFKKIYITDRMQLFFDNVDQNLQIIPNAEKFTNIDFKYSTSLDFVSLTWINLETIDKTINTKYGVRVLIFPSGQLLILFKEINNGQNVESVSHKFISGANSTEVKSGTIVHIDTSQIAKIPDKSLKQLKDVVTTKMDGLGQSLIRSILNTDLIKEFDRATPNSMPITISNKENSPVELGFGLCDSQKNIKFLVSSKMHLYTDKNIEIKLVPDDLIPTNLSITIFKQIDFVSISMNSSHIENPNYILRVNVYPDGYADVLYKKVVPAPVENVFLNATKPLKIEDGTIVRINLCEIKPPVSFNDLMSEFKSDPAAQCVNPVATSLVDVKLESYLKLNPDINKEELESKNYTILSEFDIKYETEQLRSIYVEQTVQLYLKDNAKITLVPTDGEKLAFDTDFKSTITKDYITLTWNNLNVTSNLKVSGTYYKQIRVVILPPGVIFIIYDIDHIVPNVFVPRTDPIDLKPGLIVKIDTCTLAQNSEVINAKSLSDLLEYFNEPHNNLIELNETEFNHYINLNQDSIRGTYINNSGTIKSNFKITYSDSVVNTIYISNNVQMYFEDDAILDLLRLHDGTSIESKEYYYSVTDEYVSISWYNLSVTQQKIFDIRVVVFPKGEIIVMYQITADLPIYEPLPLLGIKIKNRSVIKLTTGKIFEHFSSLWPTVLLDEMKAYNTTDLCTPRVINATEKTIKIVFGIKTDTNVLAPGQMKIPMTFKFTADGDVLDHVTFGNSTKFYLNNPTQFYDLAPFSKLTRDGISFKIKYTVTSEYVSVTLTDAIDREITPDARAVIYPTGEIIMSYKNKPTGTVTLARVVPCGKEETIGKPITPDILISLANNISFSYLTGLALGLILIFCNY